VILKEPGKPRPIRLGFGIILILIIVFPSIYFGMVLHKVGFAHFLSKTAESRSKLSIIPNYLKSLLATPEHIDIDIAFENLQKIAYKRQKALKLGHLLSSPEDWVPATVKHRGEVYRIDMRLKGDRPFHWAREEGWSFKIKVKDNKSLFGMRRFAIQNPMTRNYLDEWYLHKLLEYNGLIGLRYDFIDVSINGKHMPIYAVEENFGKRLIERNSHREGPIIRFNTAAYWEGKAPTWEAKAGLPPVLLGAPIDPYQQNKIIGDDNLRQQFDIARNLLESFRQDKLPVAKIFDVDKLATFFAIADLIGNRHVTTLDNLRFYYNPVTSLLEPVGYDNEELFSLSDNSLIGAGKLIGQKIDYRGLKERTYLTMWHLSVFKDKEFFKRYIRALERISDEKSLDGFFEKTDKKYRAKLRILHRSYPWYAFEKKPLLYENQRYIRDFLSFEKRIHPYFNSFSSEKNALLLKVCNMRSLPVEIIEATYDDKTVFNPTGEIIIQANLDGEPVNYQTLEFKMPARFSWSDSMTAGLKVRYRVLGASRIFQDTVTPWPYMDSDFSTGDFVRQPANMRNFDFLSVDEKSKRVIFKSGEWNLRKNLIIPEGYTVVAEEGLKLNISNNAKILTYSPVVLIGSEEEPIIIRSLDATGQGIVVMSAGGESVLKYVHFDNLSNPSQAGWSLTGAVTFYESPVRIIYCRFVNSRAEDALNIIRSSFEVDNTVFRGVFSDAFDADFCKGKVTASSFFDCGNDGLDLSGSVVEIRDIFIDKAGDKGISVGENSKASASGIKIKNADIAIASKDSSRVDMRDANILNCNVGLALYRKKSEFGPAHIAASNLSMDGTEVPYRVEKGSVLRVDGKQIK